MPTERRRIIFSNDEVVTAALSHCRTSGIVVPDAGIDRQTITTDGDCALMMTFAVDAPTIADEVRLDGPTLLAALIEYCRLNAIPLPRTATKRLARHDGVLSMVFEMDRPRGSVNRSIAA